MKNKQQKEIKLFVISSWFIPVSAIIVALLWKWPFLLLLALLLFAALILIQKKSKTELVLFLIVAFSGALAEIICIYAGTWSYATPQIIGIPFWLIPLWGIAGLFIYRMGKTIETIYN